MKVTAIATNTFKEVIRDKIFYSLGFFALMLIGLSVVLSTLTLGEQSRIIEDVSLAAINIVGVIISVFVGIGLVSKELEKRTIYTIISKPIQRWQFLLGKYLGLVLTLFVYLSLMTLVFIVVLYLYTKVSGLGLLLAVVFIFFELLVVTALALLFSTFTTPTLAATYTLCIYVIGHFTSDIETLAARTEDAFSGAVLRFFYYTLPNLDNFNIKSQVVHGVAIPASHVAFVAAYGALYVAALMTIAVMVFQKRNFK